MLHQDESGNMSMKRETEDNSSRFCHSARQEAAQAAAINLNRGYTSSSSHAEYHREARSVTRRKHYSFSYSFIKLSHFLLKRKPTEAIIFILSLHRYCSLETFREMFFVNKVHRKPENLSAKSCESMPSLQLVLSAPIHRRYRSGSG